MCVVLQRRARPLLADGQRAAFVKIVKRAFSQRRKMMLKLLKQDWAADKLAVRICRIKNLAAGTRGEIELGTIRGADSELTAQVRRLLEKQVGSVWVSGEITNLRAQSSGHIYFTLKDAAAQLSCVLFSREKGSASRIAGGRAEGFAARRRDGL
jgi:hypothetical protein